MGFLLTRDVSVSIFQSMEVVHELLYRNPEGLKQTRVLKEPIRNLGYKPWGKHSYYTETAEYKIMHIRKNFSFFHQLH